MAVLMHTFRDKSAAFKGSNCAYPPLCCLCLSPRFPPECADHDEKISHQLHIGAKVTHECLQALQTSLIQLTISVTLQQRLSTEGKNGTNVHAAQSHHLF